MKRLIIAGVLALTLFAGWLAISAGSVAPQITTSPRSRHLCVRTAGGDYCITVSGWHVSYGVPGDVVGSSLVRSLW